MKKQAKRKTLNDKVFEYIDKYTYNIHTLARNVPVKNIYKGEDKMRIVSNGVRLLYKGHYAASWLTLNEIQSINNPTAYKLILQILAELELFNPLWKRTDMQKDGRYLSQVSLALKILQKHGIVVPFRGTPLYYVVPTKLSCGDPLSVAFAWLEFVKTNHITPENIGDVQITKLKRPADKTYIVNILEQLFGQSPEDHSNLFTAFTSD